MIGRKLRAKKVNEGIEMPRYAHEGDAGLDLRITETVTLEPMQKCVVGCGLVIINVRKYSLFCRGAAC